MFALVTGASGLLGRHLIEELCRRGNRVRAFDLKPPSSLPPGVDFVRGDIRNAETVRAACEGVEVVFHLAGLMPQSRASAEVFHSVNVRGTENVLSAAVGESARRFVYASTVEVYGIPDHIPCAEDAPKKLLGVYSRNKLDCEELGTKYSADFGLEVVMMRMPMLLGPGFYHDKFFVKLLDDLGRGKPLYIVGNGENRHQMVACSDVVEAYLLAAELPSAAGEAFNIASDPATVPTVREMAEQAIARLGSRSKVKCVNKTLGRAALSFMSAIGRPLLMDEHRELAFADYVFDIEKAKNLLGYAPRKDNVDAIVETAQWRWKDQGLAP